MARTTGTITLNSTLEGIDVRAGMATTMDNVKLYNRLLVKFRDSQGDFANLFAAARVDSDASAAARAAHTLKGTAGNIGAKGVQAAAGELEHACIVQADAAQIDRLLAATLQQLVPVIAALQGIGAAPSPATPAPAVSSADPALVKQALDRLTALLRDGELEAADAVEALQELVQGTPMATTLNRVATAVTNCDFDAALNALKQGDL